MRVGVDTARRLSRSISRESEILTLVARGKDNHEIARELYLSVKTVQNNVSALLTKTGARSRASIRVHSEVHNSSALHICHTLAC